MNELVPVLAVPFATAVLLLAADILARWVDPRLDCLETHHHGH